MRRLWARGLGVRLALVGMGAVILSALLAPALAPCDPMKVDTHVRMQAPSAAHPFGTDQLGRDVLSRVVHGGRPSLAVGFLAVGIAIVLGSVLGIAAGYAGGGTDAAVMRLCDVMLAIPGLILALFIVAILGPGMSNLMFALGIGWVPGVARLVRGATLSLREREYVVAARALGASSLRVMGRHLLPNVLPPVLVITMLDVGAVILDAAALSYLGLGAQPPSPEWGAMLTGARDYFATAWWLSLFPGLAIALVVLCLNTLGDAARDVMSPWLHEVKG